MAKTFPNPPNSGQLAVVRPSRVPLVFERGDFVEPDFGDGPEVGPDARNPREDGERSKHMQGDMATRYERSLQDTELLNLRRDLAMMETRIHDLMDTVNIGESRTAWNELQAAGQEFNRLWHGRQLAQSQQQLLVILDLIDHGSERANGWDELQRTIELRRKLSETETKRLVALKQFVTAERAMTLIEDVMEVIKRNVLDPEVRRNCVRDLKRLIVTTPDRGD
jgi:hypothetical protein